METTIRPSRGLPSLGLRELFHHRSLIYFFAWRDVKVRYRQTLLGVTWAVLQPLATMLVFSIVFTKIVHVPDGKAPYSLFVLAALLPWQLLSTALTLSSQSLVANQAILAKVYFPRMAIPLATVLAALVDVAIGIILFTALSFLLGWGVHVTFALLPLAVVLAFSLAVAVALWLAALNVRYRDVRFAVPFLAQLWAFASPIAYPLTVVPDRWRWAFAVNPATAVVEGFRFALIGTTPSDSATLLTSTVVTVILLVSGVLYFRSAERTFADEI